jgi:hypothetical protein
MLLTMGVNKLYQQHFAMTFHKILNKIYYVSEANCFLRQVKLMTKEAVYFRKVMYSFECFCHNGKKLL